MLILAMMLLFAFAPLIFVKLDYWGRELFGEEIHINVKTTGKERW